MDELGVDVTLLSRMSNITERVVGKTRAQRKQISIHEEIRERVTTLAMQNLTVMQTLHSSPDSQIHIMQNEAARPCHDQVLEE